MSTNTIKKRKKLIGVNISLSQRQLYVTSIDLFINTSFKELVSFI